MFFLSLMATMTFYQVVWSQTKIEIPLYQSVEDYLYLPQAHLYYQQERVETEAYYEYGVNHTFISVISSQEVDTYYVDYEVIFPEFGLSFVQTIQINIVDNEAPVFIYVPSYRSSVKEKMVDVISHIVYQDNYYPKEQIRLEVDTSYVDIQKVGIYEIMYTLSDPSFNRRYITTTYEVVDLIAPDIKEKKALRHEIHEPFIWQNYFTIQDNYDTKLSITIQDQNVLYHQLGEYPLSIHVQDSSHNQSIYETMITICDTKSPTLVLTSSPKPIEVFDDLGTIDWMRYVVTLTDNETDTQSLIVKIEHDIDEKRLGTYQVYYYVEDRSHNQTTAMIKIKVVDTTAPQIKVKERILVDVFSQTFDLLEYIDIEDNYDSYEVLKIVVKSKFNFKVIGIYDFEIQVTDTNKNVGYVYDTIRVVDQEAPNIVIIEDIIIEPYEKIVLDKYLQIKDNYDQRENLDISFLNHASMWENIGEYLIEISVCDRSFNEARVQVSVYVIDQTPPILLLKAPVVAMQKNETFYPYEWVQKVYDEVTELSIEDIIILGNVKANEVGYYPLYYRVFDDANHQTEVLLEVFVEGEKTFHVEVDSLRISDKNDHQLLQGIDIQSEYQSYHVFYPKQWGEEGMHEVQYIITDLMGKAHVIKQAITIQYPRTIRDYYLTLAILITGSAIALSVHRMDLKKKKRLFF